MSMHLLIETAIYDSNQFQVLSYEEVEDLKKEHEFLGNRVDAAKRKLTLEAKVRDAALSLSRLYSKTAGRQRRKSLLGKDGSVTEVTKHTDEELVSSSRKCEELSQELWRLNNRATEIQKKLLQHSAGILGMTHGQPAGAKPTQPFAATPGSSYTLANGTMSPLTEEFDDRSLYRTPENLVDFGGRKSPSGKQQGQRRVEDDFTRERLDELNSQFRELLLDSAHHQGMPMPQHLQVDAGRGMDEQLAMLEQNIHYIQQNPPAPPAPVQVVDPKSKEQVEQMETIMMNLWDMMIMGEDEVRSQRRQKEEEGYPDMDMSDGEDDDGNREYSLSAFSGKLQRIFAKSMDLRVDRDMMKDQLSKQHATISNANAQMEGLLQKLASTQNDLKLKAEELNNTIDDFEKQRKKDQRKTLEMNASLEREAIAVDAERQARIELEEQFDARMREKQDAFAELETKFYETQEDRDMTKAELDAVIAETKDRLEGLEAEIASLKQARQQSEQARQQSDQARDTSAEQINALTTQLNEKDEEISKVDEEMRELSGKVAEISTELVMAKAELDSAYGSKSQRAAATAEARAAAAALEAASGKPQSVDPGLLQEIEDLAKKNQELIDEIVALKNERANTANNEHLNKRCKDLQTELDGMLKDFEELTKQSIENEKERNKLEGTIDSLREKSDELETLLGEEKLKQLGTRQGSIGELKSPAHRGESTSTTVLKQEFKKMMRDMRAEQARALRVRFISSN